MAIILDLYIYFRQVKMMMKNIGFKNNLALSDFFQYFLQSNGQARK